jgi:zinc protease
MVAAPFRHSRSFMSRLVRLAVLAGCSLALSACGGLNGFNLGGHGASPTQAQQAGTSAHAAPAKAGWLHLPGLGAPAFQPAPAVKVPPANVWPQAYATDLPPDPAMRFGTLANGLRYVIMKNATPSGQSSLRLRINAGSMEESDAQQGLAHFLEHMAFDGSTHVPNGEMIKILERRGLAFGADTNASTSWEETEYKLDLPKSDDDTLDTSLMLLREVASELTLEQSAIDKERGVVLSEERLRDTPGYRVLKQNLQFTLQDQLAARRFPIGQVDVIRGATHDLIADFYRKYYRPDRAVVVAVGDFDPDAIEAKIKARFGDWAASAPDGGDPDRGAVLRRGAQTRLVIEPGAAENAYLTWVSPPDLSPDSKAKRRRQVIESLALAVLNRRLDRLVREDDPPFISAGAYDGDEFHSAKVTTLQVTARPGEWRKALDAADQEVRRLAQYGVSAQELATEVDAVRAERKSAAEGEATRTTPAIAEDIVGTLSTPEVETSPSEDLALFDEDVKNLTPAEADAAIKTAVGGSGPLVMVTSPTPLDNGDKTLADAFAKISSEPVSAPAAEAALSWPYDSFGAPGQVADRKDVTDLDTVFVRFQNGVRLTVKPTKFRNDQILVQVRVGGGELDLPTDRDTPAWAASGAVPEGGLDQLSAQDIDQVLRSKIVGRQFGIGDDAFVYSGVTRPDDLDVQMQLLAASVAHPGWRPEAFLRSRNAAPTFLDQIAATPEGVLNRDLGKLMHSGDPRWGIPSRAEIAAQTPDDLKRLIAPHLADDPIEVVVVGDTTVEKAIDAVAATFGALPPRADGAGPNPAALAVKFPAPTPEPIVLTHKGRADQAVGLVAWPTSDFLSDTQETRTLNLLGAVMQLRMTQQLRKDESVTYSPSAGAAASSTFPHYGYVEARVELPPANLDGFFSDVTAIAKGLRDAPVTPDELERAKLPAFESLEKRRQTNEYWLNALAGAQTDDRKLTAIRNSEAQLQRVTADDIQKAAQTYLLDDKAWKLEVKPAAAK